MQRRQNPFAILGFASNLAASWSYSNPGFVPFQPDNVLIRIEFDPRAGVRWTMPRIDNADILPVFRPIDYSQKLKSFALPLIEYIFEIVLIHAPISEEMTVLPGCISD